MKPSGIHRGFRDPSRTISKPPSYSNPAASSEDASYASDPILSWGSSVNVCEDLRRQIKSEIERVDTDISALKQNLKAEERSSAHLTKDLSYARSEMINLVRESADELDNAIVNEQIRLKMEESLKTELINVVSPPTSPDSISVNEDLDTSLDESSVYANKKHKRDRESYDSYLSRINREKKTLQDQIRKDIMELNGTKVQIQQTMQEYKMIRQKIDSKELAKERHEAAREVETRQREKEKEIKNMRLVKEGIQMARKRCGDYAQQIVDQSKLLSTEKSNNSSYEEQASVTLEDFKRDIIELESKEIFSLESELENINNEIDQFTKQFAEVDAMRMTRVSVREKCENLKSEINILKEREKIVEDELKASNTKLNDADEKREEVIKLEKSLMAIKQENDDDEATKIQPALLKQAELIEKKEKLAIDIGDLHQKLSSEEEKYNLELVEKKKQGDVIEAKVKEVEQKIQKNEIEYNDVQKQMREQLQNTEKELDIHEDLRVKFEEAMKAEVTRKEELLKENEAKRTKLINDSLEKGAHNQCLLELKLEFYMRASEISESTNQLVQQLKETPITESDYKNGIEYHELDKFMNISSENASIAGSLSVLDKCPNTDDQKSLFDHNISMTAESLSESNNTQTHKLTYENLTDHNESQSICDESVRFEDIHSTEQLTSESLSEYDKSQSTYNHPDAFDISRSTQQLTSETLSEFDKSQSTYNHSETFDESRSTQQSTSETLSEHNQSKSVCDKSDVLDRSCSTLRLTEESLSEHNKSQSTNDYSDICNHSCSTQQTDNTHENIRAKPVLRRSSRRRK